MAGIKVKSAALIMDQIPVFCTYYLLSNIKTVVVPPGCSSGCPPGWTQFGSRCFIFYRTSRTWIDAEVSEKTYQEDKLIAKGTSQL